MPRLLWLLLILTVFNLGATDDDSLKKSKEDKDRKLIEQKKQRDPEIEEQNNWDLDSNDKKSGEQLEKNRKSHRKKLEKRKKSREKAEAAAINTGVSIGTREIIIPGFAFATFTFPLIFYR